MKISLLLFAILLAINGGCDDKANLDNDKKEILEISSAWEKALLMNDPVLQCKLPYSPIFYILYDGKIDTLKNYPTSEDSLRYVTHSKRKKWQQIMRLSQPIIKISADRKIAWSISNYKITYSAMGRDGLEKITTYFESCLTTYCKTNDKWYQEAMSCTQRNANDN